jgi:hypothetical protein
MAYPSGPAFLWQMVMALRFSSRVLWSTRCSAHAVGGRSIVFGWRNLDPAENDARERE